MKHFRDFINEDKINESMSTEDLLAIEKLLEKFQKAGSYDDFIDKISDENGEGPCKDVQRILDKYDEYMEEVMLAAIDNSDTPRIIAKRIQQMAEENEHKEGTEAHFALEFLEDLARFLKIN